VVSGKIKPLATKEAAGWTEWAVSPPPHPENQAIREIMDVNTRQKKWEGSDGAPGSTHLHDGPVQRFDLDTAQRQLSDATFGDDGDREIKHSHLIQGVFHGVRSSRLEESCGEERQSHQTGPWWWFGGVGDPRRFGRPTSTRNKEVFFEDPTAKHPFPTGGMRGDDPPNHRKNDDF